MTVRTSKPGLSADDFTLVAGERGSQLVRLDFSDEANAFNLSNVTITATPFAGRGDGFVNVGFIDASGTDLGKVSVDGDLARIVAGDSAGGGIAVKALTAHSMGRFGTSTQLPGANLESVLDGRLGALTIKTDLVNASVFADGQGGTIGNVAIGGSIVGGDAKSGLFSIGAIGNVTLGGSLLGGSATDSGEIDAVTTLGAVKIGGSLVGGSGGFSGRIESGGTMGAVSIKGSLLGGTAGRTGSIAADDTIASITLGGSLVGGTVANPANIDSGSVTTGGTASIGPVKIGGSLRGGTGFYSGVVNANGDDPVRDRRRLGQWRPGAFKSATIIGGVARRGEDRRRRARRRGPLLRPRSIPPLGDVGAVTIGGSLTGFDAADSGIQSARNLGVVKVGGSIRGDGPDGVRIQAEGLLNPATAAKAVAIAGLSVKGSVRGALILAGYDDINIDDAVNPDAAIGAVSIGGNFLATSLIAGVTRGADGQASALPTTQKPPAKPPPDAIFSKIAAHHDQRLRRRHARHPRRPLRHRRRADRPPHHWRLPGPAHPRRQYRRLHPQRHRRPPRGGSLICTFGVRELVPASSSQAHKKNKTTMNLPRTKREQAPTRQRLESCIELLETRIAPAAVFTFTDTDGDRVTITTSKGTNADLLAPNVLGFSNAADVPRQLQSIDLSRNAVFAGTNLSVIATRVGPGGDGLTAVGFIDASTVGGGTALDLGAVTIDGDLGRILAGTAAGVTSVKALTVASFGLLGTGTQAVGGTLGATFAGAVGTLTIKTDLVNADLSANAWGKIAIGGSIVGQSDGRISTSNKIGSIVIGGDLRGGTGVDSGSIGANEIGALTIGGSVLGSSGIASGRILVQKLGNVVVGGDFRAVNQTTGDTGRIECAGDIGTITVRGSIISSASGVAGIFAGGKTGKIVIGGSIVSEGNFGSVAERGRHAVHRDRRRLARRHGAGGRRRQLQRGRLADRRQLLPERLVHRRFREHGFCRRRSAGWQRRTLRPDPRRYACECEDHRARIVAGRCHQRGSIRGVAVERGGVGLHRRRSHRRRRRRRGVGDRQRQCHQD